MKQLNSLFSKTQDLPPARALERPSSGKHIDLTTEERALQARRGALARAYAEFGPRLPRLRPIVQVPTAAQQQQMAERDALIRETREAVAQVFGRQAKQLPLAWRKLALAAGWRGKGMTGAYRALDQAREKVGFPRKVVSWSAVAIAREERRKSKTGLATSHPST